jgi:hypothetical protein
VGVRGDSRQDLYAKTLALLGLGLLAGTGALVDTWPTGQLVPATAGLSLPHEFAIARPITTPADRFAASQVARLDAPRAIAEAPESTSTSPATIDALPIGSSVPASVAVALAEPPAARTLEARPLTDVPGEEIALFEPVFMTTTDADMRLAAPVSPDEDSDGFLTSAAKKTGASIVRTGVKTGASIFDAVRALSGAVRRALPN